MRVPSLLAASGLLASGLAFAAPAQAAAPAEAAQAVPPPVCKMVMPGRFYINTNSRNYTIHVTAGCKQQDKLYAQWRGSAPNLHEWVYLSFPADAETTEFNVMDSVTPIGRTYFKKKEAYNSNYDPIVTNDSVTWIKFASWSTVSAKRIGSKVTVDVRAMRYWAGGNKYIPYGKKYVVVQWKSPSSNTWNNLKALTTTAGGKASYTYTVSSARDYRVYVTASPQIWEHVSQPYRR